MTENEIITKRVGSIIKDGTSLRVTLSSELTDLGCEDESELDISLVDFNGEKHIIIKKIFK